MKCFKKLSFKYHIFLALIGVSLIPLIACSFFMIKIYTVTTEHQISKDGAQQIKNLTNRLTTLFEDQIKSCEVLCENDLAALVLIDSKTVEYQKEMYLTLYNIRTSMPTQSFFTVYDIGGHKRFSTNNDTELPIYPIYWGIINKIRQSNTAQFYAVDPMLNLNSNALIQTGYPIENSAGLHMGYIVMSLSKESLDSLFDGFYSSKDTIIITDPYQNLIYTSSPKYDNETLEKLFIKTSDLGFWYGHSIEPYSRFHIILQKPSAISKNTINSMYQLSFSIALVCLILCIIISLGISRSLVEPINKLNNAMDKVKAGDLTVYINSNRKDELGVLTDNFNHMTKELNSYVERLIKREKVLNNTKLQLFQTQLNPHFLTNTLDSIRWTAKIHELDEIVSMSENLAIILRENIAGGQFTTLKKELELIKNYINIQKIRFPNKIEYETDIPPQLEDCVVPKLLLQPIIENAIIHGLADRNSGSIFVYADQVGPNMHINITDNGNGMSQKVIDWINSKDIKKKEGHLGLYNVNNIIKLYFGQEYGLSAVVEESIGTTITVFLPITKEDSYD